MTKPNNLQDLHIEGSVSNGDVDKIAKSIFTGTTEIFGGVDGYVITLPEFDGLPDACKQFIRKAIMFSKIENVLDHDARYAAVEEPPVEVEAEVAAEAGFYDADAEPL